jgi:hypothetical protein
MEDEQILAVFDDGFPNSKIIEDDSLPEASPPSKYRQALYCNYQNQIRIIDDPVCQWHLSQFDDFCWTHCNSDWTERVHRPAFRAAYQKHLDAKKVRREATWMERFDD